MSDPTFIAQDFMQAELVLDSLLQNLCEHFQMEGLNWDRATMQAHVNIRAALLVAKELLLNEAERLLT